MALILLPDACCLPNMAQKKRKAEPAAAASQPFKVGKGERAASMSSGSSGVSKASDQSSVSSNCSFAPLKTAASEHGARVHIAIGGAW